MSSYDDYSEEYSDEESYSESESQKRKKDKKEKKKKSKKDKKEKSSVVQPEKSQFEIEEEARRAAKRKRKEEKEAAENAAMAAERFKLERSLFGVVPRGGSSFNCPMRPEEGIARMEMDEAVARNVAGGQCRGGKQSSSEPASQGLR
mmetsp:Transcript_129628/g.288983  ORF Transcript_129628/g.288983 Transcript_129628/m.288983 type:complete len:147 (+) Transcript_129628:158-598(+)